MKRIVFAICCCLALITLFGCTNSTVPKRESETRMESSETQMESIEVYFDYQQLNHPTDQQMSLINKGMKYQQVESLIGLPHGFADGISSGMVYKWITDKGYIYYISFLTEEDYSPASRNISLSEYRCHLVVYACGLVSIDLTNKPCSSSEISISIDGINYYEILNRTDQHDYKIYLTMPLTHVGYDSKVYAIVENKVMEITRFCILPKES